MGAPHWLFADFVVVFCCFGLLLIADSWLAYKTTLVTGMGIFTISLINMCFRSGRPFWDLLDISSNNLCLFSFAGPSATAFYMTFFWPYVITIFSFKYHKNPPVIVNFLLLGLLCIFWVDIYLYVLINGLNYIYQMVLG